MKSGQVVSIHIAPDSGDVMEAVEAADGVAGRGLRGDRYYEGVGLWNYLDQDPNRERKEASEITFIEAEALDAIERDAGITLETGAHRRNITTRDVALNHLVGERFEVGELVCEGVGLCEPCGYMQSLVGQDGVAKSLVHRGGLNARIIESGPVRVDDEIRW